MHSLADCTLASTITLNMVQMDCGTRKSVARLLLCSLASKATRVLEGGSGRQGRVRTERRGTVDGRGVYRLMQDSIMSLDISLSRVSRCLPNSSSGQCRSLMKVCRASSFQKRSSEVPDPLLEGGGAESQGRVKHRKGNRTDAGGTQDKNQEKGEGRAAGVSRGPRNPSRSDPT